MSGPYDDIIHLPHHVSPTRPRMSLAERAAQFSPFAALTGFEGVLQETRRLTDAWAEPDEDVKAELDRKLQRLSDRLAQGPEASFTYFVPDEKKAGGTYVTASGPVRKIDVFARRVVLRDGTEIPIDRIVQIELPPAGTAGRG